MADSTGDVNRISSKVEVKENFGEVYGVFSQYTADVINLYKHDRLRIYSLVFLGILILGCALGLSERFFRVRHYAFRTPVEMHEDLRIVGLDARYKDENGITDKARLATIINQLYDAGARVIGLDYIVEQDDPGYDMLVEQVKTTPGLVFTEERFLDVDENKSNLNLKFPVVNAIPADFVGYVGRGYSNLDAPYTWQMKLMSERMVDVLGGGPAVPSFALAVAAAWHFPDQNTTQGSGEKWKAVLDAIKFPYRDPEDATEGVPVDFFDINDLSKYVIPADRLAQNPDVFRDRVVLVGAYEDAPWQTEMANTNVISNSKFKSRSLLDTPAPNDTFITPYGTSKGIMVHAAIINNLMHEQYLRRAGTIMVWVILLASFCCGFGIMFSFNITHVNSEGRAKQRHALPVVLILILMGAYLGSSLLVFKYVDLLLPVRPVWIALLSGGFLALIVLDVLEAQARRRLQSLGEKPAADDQAAWTYED